LNLVFTTCSSYFDFPKSAVQFFWSPQLVLRLRCDLLSGPPASFFCSVPSSYFWSLLTVPSPSVRPAQTTGLWSRFEVLHQSVPFDSRCLSLGLPPSGAGHQFLWSRVQWTKQVPPSFSLHHQSTSDSPILLLLRIGFLWPQW
jgi:hypothetical protein